MPSHPPAAFCASVWVGAEPSSAPHSASFSPKSTRPPPFSPCKPISARVRGQQGAACAPCPSTLRFHRMRASSIRPEQEFFERNQGPLCKNPSPEPPGGKQHQSCPPAAGAAAPCQRAVPGRAPRAGERSVPLPAWGTIPRGPCTHSPQPGFSSAGRIYPKAEAAEREPGKQEQHKKPGAGSSEIPIQRSLREERLRGSCARRIHPRWNQLNPTFPPPEGL